MQSIRAVVWIVLGIAIGWSAAAFGASFAEDYLNYLRMGPHSGSAAGRTVLTGTAPLGQTFTLAPDVGEVYRIRVRIGQEDEDWQADEAVTLKLWDSPGRSQLLGEYTRTAADRNLSGDAKNSPNLMFPLRVAVAGGETLYFELVHNAEGDGQVPVELAESGADGSMGYRAGAPTGEHLWFEVHVKLRRERDVLFGSFFDKVNLDLGGLEPVKSAVERRDWESAMAQFVQFCEAHSAELQKDWIDNPERPGPRPDFDRTTADLWLEGYLTGEGGARMRWRPESNWTPRTPFKPDWERPRLNGFFIMRALGYAYWSTGDERFARKAMQLRRQWLLDNPNPYWSGIRYDHETWNELAAVGRAPGHGLYAYGRFYYSPEFTVEDRFVWYLSFYENAAYLRPSTVGGNWGFQTFETLLRYALDHPEWKESPEWMAHARGKLVDLTLETVRADGTEHEAAIKYHMMCARRLFTFLKDNREGAFDLAEDVRDRLLTALEGMYEHGAYMLKPDGYVVMSGDSWLENYSEELIEVGRFIGREDFVWIGSQGREGKPPQEISKAFPLGGYFLMRDHFGEQGKPYQSAVQLVIHNGGSIGSHFHGDFTAINLYAGSNTLLVDPGQYDYDTEPRYWWSSQHSMVTVNGADAKREPGRNVWRSTPEIDYYEGDHRGYRGYEITRRVVFIKPRFVLVQDDIAGPEENQATFDQVWHLGTAGFTTLDEPRRYRTQFDTGANLEIIPVETDGTQLVVEKGLHNATGGTAEGALLKLRRVTTAPLRYLTLLAIDFGGQSVSSPVRLAADKGCVVQFADGDHTWTVVLGAPGTTTRFGSSEVTGRTAVIGERAGKVVHQWMMDVSSLLWNGIRLVQAPVPPGWASVSQQGDELSVRWDDDLPQFAVHAQPGQRVHWGNGPAALSAETAGLIDLLDATASVRIVCDAPGPAFTPLTQTTEWDEHWHGEPFGNTFFVHETDVGRIETGQWAATLPKTGDYVVETYWPRSMLWRSEDVRYVVPGALVKGAGYPRTDAVKEVRPEGDRTVITVDQSKDAGTWTPLGVFTLPAGPVVVRAENHSPDDGRYPMFDAIRFSPF